MPLGRYSGTMKHELDSARLIQVAPAEGEIVVGVLIAVQVERGGRHDKGSGTVKGAPSKGGRTQPAQ